MIRVRSAIAQRFGQTPNKLGLNLLEISWDGSSTNNGNILHLDTRNLYKLGNNMGVNFLVENGGVSTTADIKGSVKNFPAIYNRAKVEAWLWSPIVALASGGTFFYNDAPEMYGTLRIQFGANPGTLYINRG